VTGSGGSSGPSRLEAAALPAGPLARAVIGAGQPGHHGRQLAKGFLRQLPVPCAVRGQVPDMPAVYPQRPDLDPAIAGTLRIDPGDRAITRRSARPFTATSMRPPRPRSRLSTSTAPAAGRTGRRARPRPTRRRRPERRRCTCPSPPARTRTSSTSTGSCSATAGRGGRRVECGLSCTGVDQTVMAR